MTSDAIAARIVPRDADTRLRPAASADEPFARDLYMSSRAAEFAAAGLAPSALATLLDQQLRAQGAGYAAQFPDAITFTVVRTGQPVGRLILRVGDRCWRIIDILLHPSVRGQGIGTDIIEAIARAARGHGAGELGLAVLATNAAARRLYLRLGFVERGGEAHVEMTRALDGTSEQPA